MPTTGRRKRKRTGFTITEILVVVVIVAVLATLIVPKLWGRIGWTRQRVAKGNLPRIETAIEMFGSDYGRLPDSLDELVHRPADIDEADWNDPSLRAKDLKDPWGREFIYVVPGEHGRYDLYSLGADGQPGGEKENADVNNWE
ncbi:MAG: type II secretion system major pseudopilin GspG [Planctomycetota bacterium]|jgi:general secretion pathway protein G